MTQLNCVRCDRPATIGEHDDAIGSFLACSDECHAAELAERVAHYQDEAAGVAQRKRERIAAIRAGEIQHPGYVVDQAAPTAHTNAAEIKLTQLEIAMARIEGRGAERLK